MTSNMISSLLATGAETDLICAPAKEARVLWGVAPTGSIHLGYAGYLFLLRKLRDAGAKVILLLANYHGYLDSDKADWESLDARTQSYREVFAKTGFNNVLETKDFYRSPDYIERLFHLSRGCGVGPTLAAGQGTLRSPLVSAAVSDLLYVTTQVLDVHFLQAHLVICGLDEAPIYRFGLPLLRSTYGWTCSFIYLPKCPGLVSAEMHASDAIENKILLSDSHFIVRSKISRYCATCKTTPPLFTYLVQSLLPLAGRQDLAEGLRSMEKLQADKLASELSACVSAVLTDLHLQRL